MLRAYQGFSNGNGQFTAIDRPQIPKGFKVYILVAEEEPLETNMQINQASQEKLTPAQQASVQKILSDIEAIKEEDFTQEDKDSFAKWDRGEYRLDFEERLP